MTVNLHFHIDNVHIVNDDKKLNQILEVVNSLNSKIDKIMTKQERFDTVLTRIDAVTTNIAEDFAAFIKEAQEGTVSEESIAKAEANVTKLEELAATKENPVPGEEIPPADQP